MLDAEALKKLFALVTQLVAFDAELAWQAATNAEKAVAETVKQYRSQGGRVRPSDWLIQKAMAPELPRVTASEWNGLLEVREILEEGLTEDDPERLKAILKRADDVVSRLIGGSVIVPDQPKGFRVEKFEDHGLEANLTRLFEWIGLTHEEARENAWDLADAIREAEEKKIEGEMDEEDEED
jgi:hypothetical protein